MTQHQELERITKFKPAFDRRDSNPSKNYGIGCVQCFMVLKGNEGAVHFTFSTGMLLPETVDEYIRSGKARYEVGNFGVYYLNKPTGYDVGYHSPVPLYEYQKEYGGRENCDWLGGPCFSDGSALRADEWLDIFLREGSDKIWEMLELEYKERFYENKITS